MKRTILGTFGAALAALALAACVPEFAHPVVGGAKADPALMGSWNAAPETETESISIVIEPNGEGIRVLLANPMPGATPEDKMVLTGTTAEIDGRRYVNLHPEAPDAETFGHLIFTYEPDGERIKVRAFNPKKIAEAVEKGAIEGVTTGSGPEITTKISATSEQVAAFLATPEGQAAFETAPDEVLILTKVAP